MKTSDRGQHWTEENDLTGLSLQFPTFLDKSHVWLASEHGTIARTVDGGEHWSVSRDLPKNISSIFFLTPLIGWTVGENGLVARTEDGGVHWSKEEVDVPYDKSRQAIAGLNDVFFLSSELGWICGTDGLVLSTTDGGRHWIPAESVTKEPLVSIRFIDAKHGWAVGGFTEPSPPTLRPSNVVVETTDGGKTWKKKEFNSPAAKLN
jgi:photosystem II stability/assembly factor-like uncharacterized protein